MAVCYQSFYCVRKAVYCTGGNCPSCLLPDVGSYTYTYDNQTSPKKRIVEKFDDKGDLIERITEEV